MVHIRVSHISVVIYSTCKANFSYQRIIDSPCILSGMGSFCDLFKESILPQSHYETNISSAATDIDLVVILSFVSCSLGLGFGVLNSGPLLGLIGFGCGSIFSILALHHVKTSHRPQLKWSVPHSNRDAFPWEQMWSDKGNN